MSVIDSHASIRGIRLFRPRKRRSGRLLVESAIVIVSVLFAFGLNEWRLLRADDALARTVLTSFQQEIGDNLALLEQYRPRHIALAEAVLQIPPESLVGRSAAELLLEARTGEGAVIMPLAEGAWQTAVSTGALRLLDYETAALLSGIYHAQQGFFDETVSRLMDRIFDAPMFEPTARVETIRVFGNLLMELVGQEAFLMERYRVALEHLEGLGI
jgi:hypothetical protein